MGCPWENEDEPAFNPEEYRKKALTSLLVPKEQPQLSRSSQICINGSGKKHIGWCNAYGIDNDYQYIVKGGRCTLGIDIPDMKSRHKGYATAAWDLFIQYFLQQGIADIYNSNLVREC